MVPGGLKVLCPSSSSSLLNSMQKSSPYIVLTGYTVMFVISNHRPRHCQVIKQLKCVVSSGSTLSFLNWVLCTWMVVHEWLYILWLCITLHFISIIILYTVPCIRWNKVDYYYYIVKAYSIHEHLYLSFPYAYMYITQTFCLYCTGGRAIIGWFWGPQQSDRYWNRKRMVLGLNQVKWYYSII